MAVEVACGLAGLGPAPVLPTTDQLPQRANLACEAMILGRPSLAQPARDLREKEWEWDEGLLENHIQLVLLIQANQDLAPDFARRSWYRRLAPNLYEFAPTSAQRRAMLRHIAARQALKQGRLNSALWLLSQAERDFPEQAAIQAGLARTCWLLGRMQPARQHLSRALTLEPDNAEARGLRSLLD